MKLRYSIVLIDEDGDLVGEYWNFETEELAEMVAEIIMEAEELDHDAYDYIIECYDAEAEENQ